jgi:serine/threonine-protein kinase SRK2
VLQGMMVPEADARLLFQQLIVAMDYCHRLGIVNRDVKVGGSALSASCFMLSQPPKGCPVGGANMTVIC